MTEIDYDDPVIFLLTQAKIQLLVKRPFFGQIAASLEFVDASKWCKTAATDGRHFFYNRSFILSLTPNEVRFLIGHEVLHCVYGHLGRRGNRDKDVWNMACDYMINYGLVREQVGTPISFALYNKSYTDDMSSEEIYDLLIENSVEILVPLDEHLEIEDEDENDTSDETGDGDPDSNSSGDNDRDGDGDGGGQGQVKVRVIGSDGPPKLTKKDMAEIQKQFRETLLRTITSVKAGDIPLSIRRFIDDLIEPRLDWRSMLDTHIRSSQRDDFTFQVMARRTHIMRTLSRTGATVNGLRVRPFIFPGNDFLETIDVCIAVDASGSLSEEMLREIVSEIKGIMETFKDFRLQIWSFDTVVDQNSYMVFTQNNIDELTEWKNTKLIGGGGTKFECNWEFMRSKEIEPHRFVMFTDGLPNLGWGDPNYCDTLFVIHADPHSRITAPFGITAHYNG